MTKFLEFLSLKLKPSGTAASRAASPIVPPTLSPLLRDILGETAASSLAVESDEKKASASALSQRLSVGARLADDRRRAIEVASKLISLSDQGTAQTISVLIEDLKKRVYCIAFAGQMKAGKSSLINILVEEPDLLPTGINPLTTVITRLHFGVPGRPQSGASFAFFSRDEWRRLSAGGRTRELTERLFPDFDWNALNTQVEAMQQRAVDKCGPDFEDLLGTHHIRPEITPGLLNRYVGAGHPDAEGSQAGAEGEYSDITKFADVFLDLGAFSFPTILIDTPGVNDPFLVRDEITRQNLEEADICVVVLTAKQPLSAADLNLIRVLRGLKKERLIIFINKIDEIRGGEEVLRELSHRITAILKRELPSAHIPIVLGSVMWARKALSSNTIANQELAAQVGDTGESSAAFDWPGHAEIADSVISDTYFSKSGLSSLAVAISEMMRDGPAAAAIGATGRVLEAVCSNLISWLKIEIGILGMIPADLSSAKSELVSLKALKAGLETEFDSFSKSLATFRAQKVDKLFQELTSTAETSIAESLSALSGDTIIANVSQIDTKLRVKLESIFLATFEDVDHLIGEEQERLRTELMRLFGESSLNEKFVVLPGLALAISPSLSALSEPATLSLTDGQRALVPSPLPAIQSTDLLDIIRRDFEPVIEKLTAEAGRVMNEGFENLVHQIKVLMTGPLDVGIQRISREIQEAEMSPADSLSVPQSLIEHMQAISELIANLSLILPAGEPPVPA